MSAVVIRPEQPGDAAAIAALVEAAFGQDAEALLVSSLRAAGDVVLSLVAERDGELFGHVLFSRLMVEGGAPPFAAVALAPIAVDPGHQRQGIGGQLIEDAHLRLRRAGETLSVVLGEPSFYGRFGYAHERAAGFGSDYQCEALQAVAWGDAPTAGRLVYAPAFSAL